MTLDSNGNVASESSEPFSIAWDFANIAVCILNTFNTCDTSGGLIWG